MNKFNFRAWLRNILAYVCAVIIMAVLCALAVGMILVAQAERSYDLQRARQAEVGR